MVENFENEKEKIKIAALKILLEPVCDLAKIIDEISQEDRKKYQEIFWNVSEKLPGDYTQIAKNLLRIFPAFLSALSGDYSEDRVIFLAEYVLTEVKYLQQNAKNRPPVI